MVYDIRYHWVFGLLPFSGMLQNTKEHVSETDPFSEMLYPLEYRTIDESPETQ
jgi:hypothetical protein